MGTIAIQYGLRKLTFKVFDKLTDIDQGQIVDNKRLGAVLKFAQEKQQEFEQQQTRNRSKKPRHEPLNNEPFGNLKPSILS